jgi:GT2 family glycosyltransferase
MQVSFILPLFNGLALTQECLRTLQATLPAGLAHEIILVDDGSSDGTRGWLAGLGAPCRVLLNERNLGFAGTCNRGAQAATGELLCFLNNDLVLPPHWLEPMLTVHARLGPRAGLVGNLQHRVDDGSLDHAGITVTTAGKLEHIRTAPPAAPAWRDAFAVTAACCLLRRETFLSAGSFDESFRNGGEDIDLALRLRARGLRVAVATGSVVRHHVSAARGPTSRRDEANSRLIFARWPAEVEAAVATAWAHAPVVPPDRAGAFSRWADRLHSAGWRRHPSERAILLARSAVWRETARWQALFGESPPLPVTPLSAPEGFTVDPGDTMAWLRESARLVLPPGVPVRNLFVNGHHHPPEPGAPETIGPLGLRICINGLQTREVFPLPLGDYNFGCDAPATLPDRPTVVEIRLLGVARTNRLGVLGRIVAGWPLPRSWRAHLGRYRGRRLNRRLRLAQVIADDREVCSFRTAAPVGPPP